MPAYRTLYVLTMGDVMEELSLFDVPASACSLEECQNPARRVGLCEMHYMRRWRYGRFDVPSDQWGKVCMVCEAPIPQPDGVSRNRRRKFCSHSCFHLDLKARQYQATGKQIMRMYESQNGQCAICGVLLAPVNALTYEVKKRSHLLHIDHDHSTGEVRAILCGGCNAGLGQFREDPDILRAAIKYLENHARP